MWLGDYRGNFHQNAIFEGTHKKNKVRYIVNISSNTLLEFTILPFIRPLFPGGGGGCPQTLLKSLYKI
jgi:hypothetical protein